MVNLIIGLFLLALGIWAIFDEIFFVEDFMRGFLPMVMSIMGVFSLALYCVGKQKIK